jgi:hypothetical protein
VAWGGMVVACKNITHATKKNIILGYSLLLKKKKI